MQKHVAREEVREQKAEKDRHVDVLSGNVAIRSERVGCEQKTHESLSDRGSSVGE